MHALILLSQALAPESGSFSLISLITAVALVILALIWLLLPLLVLNELAKVRRQLVQTEENITAALRQLSPMVQQLQEGNDVQRQAMEALETVSVHLYNIDGEAQHTNTLLEWLGSQRSSQGTGSPRD